MRSASMPSRRPGVACRGGRCWAVWPPERLLPCLAWAVGKLAPSRAAGAAIAPPGRSAFTASASTRAGPTRFPAVVARWRGARAAVPARRSGAGVVYASTYRAQTATLLRAARNSANARRGRSAPPRAAASPLTPNSSACRRASRSLPQPSILKRRQGRNAGDVCKAFGTRRPRSRRVFGRHACL